MSEFPGYKSGVTVYLFIKILSLMPRKWESLQALGNALGGHKKNLKKFHPRELLTAGLCKAAK